MAVQSREIPLGMKVPDFELLDVVSGQKRSLQELKSERATVIMFICNHCPYVKHIVPKLVEVAREYIPKGVSFIAINSNDPETYPEDSPEKMREVAQQLGYPFPYLFDETQEVARAYGAQCTPEFFVTNAELHLLYHGRFDASTPGNGLPVTGEDLRAALDVLLAGRPVPYPQYPAIGCSIKWRQQA
ncbi:MAG: thioredoxin family protein [Chlorobiota bacterium]